MTSWFPRVLFSVAGLDFPAVRLVLKPEDLNMGPAYSTPEKYSLTSDFLIYYSNAFCSLDTRTRL